MSFSEEQEVARIMRTMSRWNVTRPAMAGWLGGMNHQLPNGPQTGVPQGQPNPPVGLPQVQPPLAPQNPLVGQPPVQPPQAPPNPLQAQAQPPLAPQNPPLAPNNPPVLNIGQQAGGMPQGLPRVPPPGGRPAPLQAAVRAPRVSEARRTLDQADTHERGTKAPTGAWPVDATIGGGANTVEVSGDRGTAIVDKNTLAVTAEKLGAMNTALAQGGSSLRFAETQTQTWIRQGEASLLEVRPVLDLAAGGPDDALRQRREAGENVTYADCHRSAVVAAGFGFDPRAGRDCQTPALPTGVFRVGEVRDGAKIDNLKALNKDTPLTPDTGPFNMMANADRYVGSVGERKTRGVVGAYLPKTTTKFPSLVGPFAAVDGMTQRMTDNTLDNFSITKVRGNRIAAKRNQFVAGRTGKNVDDLENADFTPLRGDPDYPNALSNTEEQQLQADMVTIDAEKQELTNAKKTWSKYNLLTLCADAMKKPGADANSVKAELRAAIGLNMSETNLNALLDTFPVDDAVAAYNEMCQTLKMNEHCKPKAGQVMSVVTPGASVLWKEVKNDRTDAELSFRKREYVAHAEGVAPANVDEAMMARHRGDYGIPKDPETWNFHWAAVIATSGNEYTTMENFSVEDPAAINDKQCFNAFGPQKSLYDHYKDSGFFGSSAIAMCFDKAS